MGDCAALDAIAQSEAISEPVGRNGTPSDDR